MNPEPFSLLLPFLGPRTYYLYLSWEQKFPPAPPPTATLSEQKIYHPPGEQKQLVSANCVIRVDIAIVPCPLAYISASWRFCDIFVLVALNFEYT